MINNYLLRISDYMQTHKLPFRRINLSFSIMPSAFYRAIVHYLKQAVFYDASIKIDSFDICFDENDKAYIRVIGNNGKTMVNVICDYYRYQGLPASKIVKASEFEESVKQIDDRSNAYYLNNLPEEFKKRFLSQKSGMDITSLLDKSFDTIFAYMRFLENEYKNNIERISYIEHEGTSSNRHKTKRNDPTIRVRKNAEIPIDLRSKVLDQYGAVYSFQAESDKGTIYHARLYKVSGKRFKLVLEPDEANKYTKVVSINSDEVSRNEAKLMAIRTLQESRDALTSRSDVTRHQRTTPEAYKVLMEYLLNQSEATQSKTSSNNPSLKLKNHVK